MNHVLVLKIDDEITVHPVADRRFTNRTQALLWLAVLLQYLLHDHAVRGSFHRGSGLYRVHQQSIPDSTTRAGHAE